MTDDLPTDTDASDAEASLDDAVEAVTDERVEAVDDPAAPVQAESAQPDVAEAASAEAQVGDAVAAADVVVGEDELLEPTPEPEPRESPYDRPGRWYVVHSYAGYEKKVKADLENRISAMNMEEKIFEVVIPTEEVEEIKNGKKVRVEKKMFPGYLLVRCALDDDDNVWYTIRNTPGITGFVGPGTKPTPLSRKEVDKFLQTPLDGEEGPSSKKPRTTHGFVVGQAVRVLTGPFAEFPGTINEIDDGKQEITVLVDIFGRETPVKLGFGDIADL